MNDKAGKRCEKKQVFPKRNIRYPTKNTKKLNKHIGCIRIAALNVFNRTHETQKKHCTKHVETAGCRRPFFVGSNTTTLRNVRTFVYLW